MAELAVGIDLGTSNSCVAVIRDGKLEVLPNAYGENTTASVVAFNKDGTLTVGNAARANVIHDPAHTISSAKRLIGRYFFSEEVKKAQAVCAYEIIEGPNHGVRIQVRDEVFSLPEVSAMVLREMKLVAEASLGTEVKQAVITVPAYFNDNQRQATKDAGAIAGLEVLRILNEPTAAALAYGFGKGLDQRVAVYDLGGGTFDISILEIGKDIFEVLSTCGDTFLGGDDFDDRIIDLVADEFVAAEGINIRNDPYAFEKLKVAAEAAKRGLSIEEDVEIRIPDVIVGADGQPRSIERTITTPEFNALVMDLIMRTFKVCDEALQQADLTVSHLDGVILVGGPTRLPVIRQAVRDYFQQEPRSDVDPDEVVAMGAAIHANSLVSETAESFLLDVTPHDLRIGVAGGLAEPIIEANTPVPIEQTRAFTTFGDYQESVEIRVYQGDSRTASENELLGQFEFSGFKKARRGDVTIDVTFEINADGIVNVRALDPETGAETATCITLSSGLSPEELASILEENPAARVVSSGPPRADAKADAKANAKKGNARPAALPSPGEELETDDLDTGDLEVAGSELDELETDDLETDALETDDVALSAQMLDGRTLEPVDEDESELELLETGETPPIAVASRKTAAATIRVSGEAEFAAGDLRHDAVALDATDVDLSGLDERELDDVIELELEDVQEISASQVLPPDTSDYDTVPTLEDEAAEGVDELFDRNNKNLSAGLDDD